MVSEASRSRTRRLPVSAEVAAVKAATAMTARVDRRTRIWGGNEITMERTLDSISREETSGWKRCSFYFRKIALVRARVVSPAGVAENPVLVILPEPVENLQTPSWSWRARPQETDNRVWTVHVTSSTPGRFKTG